MSWAGDGLTVAGAATVFALGARAARRPEVGVSEEKWFGRINALPARWFAPVWFVMQLGSVGGVAATSAALLAMKKRRLAARVGTSGLLAWLASKAVKRFVGRGRPASVIATARVLGREQTGLGYPSGHAAVTTAMVLAAAPQLKPATRRAAQVVPLLVGSARLYVGAHLPLDVVGGVAVGVASAAAVHAAETLTDPG